MTGRPLHILAFLEAQSITGPAKNLLEFCRLAPALSPPLGPMRVTIATFRRGPQDSDPLLTAAAAQGTPIETIAERNALDFRTLVRMRALCARLQPDIVQTHSVKSNFLIRMSGLSRRMPWVAWHHGYTQPTRKQEFYNRLDRLSLPSARAVVTVTDAFVPELRRMGVAGPIEIVRNALPLDWMQGVRADTLSKATWAKPGEKLVLAIGRLSKEKAHADLVEALVQLRGNPSAPPFRLLVLGEGPERRNLEALASERKVNVTFAGQISDVRPYFAIADYFVLPSHSEGSPNVLIEAMAAGVPLVATNVGGVSETAGPDEAILVPPARPDALAQGLLRLAMEPVLASQLAENARSRVQREFLPLPRAERIAALYRRAVTPQ